MIKEELTQKALLFIESRLGKLNINKYYAEDMAEFVLSLEDGGDIFSIESIRQSFLCGVKYADAYPKETDVGIGDEEIDFQLETWPIKKKKNVP